MPFAPAGNLTSTAALQHFATVYYDRNALSSLRKNFMFWKGVDNRTLPLKNGKTIQFYRYSQLGANTTATAEGTGPGASLEMSSATVSATVSQYADFISFSDMIVDTAIDNDIVAVGADQLGYRAGLSVDTMIRNEIDSVAASIDVSLIGDYFTALDGANIRTRFRGLEVKPKEGNYYTSLIHPYIRYDFIHDPQVGGFMDVTKQGQTGQLSTFESPDNGAFVGRFDGVEYWESTNVKVTSGSPNTYRCYFFGQEGLAAIDLAGRGPTRTMSQDQTKFSVKVVKDAGVSVANPEGKIKAFASYNFVFVAKVLDTNPYRIRKIDAPSSLGL